MRRNLVIILMLGLAVAICLASVASADIAVGQAPWTYEGDYNSCDSYEVAADDVRLDPINILWWEYGYPADVKPCNDI